MHASFARNSVRTVALAVKAGSPLVGAFILSCYLVPVVVVVVGTGNTNAHDFATIQAP